MQAPKSLRRPGNWQDFETLCKKLWGEIWNCTEMKKNGRAGQAQNGVDIYGVLPDGISYFGIQCKVKDENTDKPFTTEEISSEIDKAKTFRPALKKLYLATTAVKDARLEEFVREKNVENISQGFFEVHLYCWEDIAELIEENKQTADWYIQSRNYKASHNALLTFGNGETELIAEPKFRQHNTVYRMDYPMPSLHLGIGFGMDHFLTMNAAMDRMIPRAFTIRPGHSTETNLSLFPVNLWLHNTGTEPLEEYKVYLTFEGEIVELSRRNTQEKYEILGLRSKYQPTTYISNQDKTVTLLPRNSILVHDEYFHPDVFYIKPSPESQKITLHYKLLSRNFKAEGSLVIEVCPDIQVTSQRITVETEEQERIEPGEIEDFTQITRE